MGMHAHGGIKTRIGLCQPDRRLIAREIAGSTYNDDFLYTRLPCSMKDCAQVGGELGPLNVGVTVDEDRFSHEGGKGLTVLSLSIFTLDAGKQDSGRIDLVPRFEELAPRNLRDCGLFVDCQHAANLPGSVGKKWSKEIRRHP